MNSARPVMTTAHTARRRPAGVSRSSATGTTGGPVGGADVGAVPDTPEEAGAVAAVPAPATAPERRAMCVRRRRKFTDDQAGCCE